MTHLLLMSRLLTVVPHHADIIFGRDLFSHAHHVSTSRCCNKGRECLGGFQCGPWAHLETDHFVRKCFLAENQRFSHEIFLII